MPSVLIVEDEWLLRMELAEALAEAGYVVTESGSGEDALHRLASGARFDLLVTDIRLKGARSGWDVATAWRGYGGSLPVIYVSADNPDDPRRVTDSEFLAKPVVLAKFLATCRSLLETG
jgi:CheY-like chemotaxis protein